MFWWFTAYKIGNALNKNLLTTRTWNSEDETYRLETQYSLDSRLSTKTKKATPTPIPLPAVVGASEAEKELEL